MRSIIFNFRSNLTLLNNQIPKREKITLYILAAKLATKEFGEESPPKMAASLSMPKLEGWVENVCPQSTKERTHMTTIQKTPLIKLQNAIKTELGSSLASKRPTFQ